MFVDASERKDVDGGKVFAVTIAAFSMVSLMSGEVNERARFEFVCEGELWEI